MTGTKAAAGPPHSKARLAPRKWALTRRVRGTIECMVDWPHAPPHRFSSDGVYFVTAATYLKRHYYRRAAALDRFVAQLFSHAREFEVTLQSWSMFSNHYHLVAQGGGLRQMLARLHSIEAKACNAADGVPGRQVWYQYRDTELTYEKSWLARLKYTLLNPVKHGLVRRATDYRWCSASWFETWANASFRKSVERFPIDRVKVEDEFEVVGAEEE